MQGELDARESNHTWDVVPWPTGKHSIGCRWDFKIKRKPDGSIDWYKAHLVAREILAWFRSTTWLCSRTNHVSVLCMGLTINTIPYTIHLHD